eukprot:629145-Pelagomonas_calceolata.AAC.1
MQHFGCMLRESCLTFQPPNYCYEGALQQERVCARARILEHCDDCMCMQANDFYGAVRQRQCPGWVWFVQ